MQPEIRIEICDDPDTVITNEKASSLIKKASNSTLFDLNSIDALKSSHPEFHNIFQDSSTQIKCPICKQKLSNNTISLDKLKPRFLGHLKSIFTFELSDLSIRVCKKDLNDILQQKVDSLLTQEGTDLSKLQEDSMAFLSKAEAEENHWQDRFLTGRTFGQVASDAVALTVGSWFFVIAVLSILASWSTLNLLLPLFGNTAWDPYPFILLNLFLSIIATMQGPIIMMSQNRQGDIERVQNNYIRKIILRGEYQTRLVNTKMDYLLTNQWRRLLEIQEIQVDLLQLLQTQGSPKSDKNMFPSADRDTAPKLTPLNKLQSSKTLLVPKVDVAITEPVVVKSYPWTVEINPDEHTSFIMRHYLNKASQQDTLLFSHWTVQGESFTGNIRNVKLEITEVTPQISKSKNRGVISVGDVPIHSVVKGISYEIQFAISDKVTLDDILSGDSNITLRNDFDIPYMKIIGKIKRVEIYPIGKPSVLIQNGSFPQRYKPSFSNCFNRIERITEFWSCGIEKIQIYYSVPVQVAIVSVGKGWFVKEIHVEFFKPEQRVSEVELVMKSADRNVDPITLVDQISSGFTSNWKRVAKGDFSELKNVNSDVIVDGMGGIELQGPNNFIFAAVHARVVISGVFEEFKVLT